MGQEVTTCGAGSSSILREDYGLQIRALTVDRSAFVVFLESAAASTACLHSCTSRSLALSPEHPVSATEAIRAILVGCPRCAGGSRRVEAENGGSVNWAFMRPMLCS
jgi:hypothetical protein